LDYSRYRYEQQKRLKEIKKNQKIVQLKEVQLSPTIGIHDFNTKLKNAKRFIADGNKVKVTMRLYGRMMSRQELGLEVINNFILEMEEIATLESSAKMEGRTLIAILNPKKE
jgi:translation initiation factor IF-3